ncbi:MAG: DUF4012 domain-containing protein, partial [Firmicutes bacterium]|nr:DUF4012 domain-containing protein [Bacillota bacterium]
DAVLLWHAERAAKAAKADKNFFALEQAVATASGALDSVQGNLRLLFYLKWIPGVAPLYRNLLPLATAGADGTRAAHTVLPSLAPVAAAFGYRTAFSAQAALPDARQKLAVAAADLPAIAGALRAAYPDLQAAQAQLNAVPTQGIPRFLAAREAKVLAPARRYLNLAVQNLPTLMQAAPVVQEILGYPTPQRYLVFFQNSGEMRPTGGFMTAYGILTFDHGAMGRLQAHDIYSLIGAVQYRPPAPAVFTHAFGILHWHIRDANTSPDVPTTVANIYRFYDSIPHVQPVSGVIFTDVWLVDALLKDVGGVTLPPPYNIRLTAANANYEMEYLAEKAHIPGITANTRKAFIGEMFHELLHKVFSARGSRLLAVARTLGEALHRKWVMVYFNNPQAEALVARYNWGGIVDRHTGRADYLQIVDENLMGHKDNYYLNESVSSLVVREPDGRYLETTRVTWVNPAVYNGWMVVPYRALIRLYVPKGSVLMGIYGIDGFLQNHTNPVLNKSVFGGHIDMPYRPSYYDPPARQSMTVTYLLPKGIDPRRFIIQEQPGIKPQQWQITVGSVTRRFILTHDMTLTFPRSAADQSAP